VNAATQHTDHASVDGDDDERERWIWIQREITDRSEVDGSRTDHVARVEGLGLHPLRVVGLQVIPVSHSPSGAPTVYVAAAAASTTTAVTTATAMATTVKALIVTMYPRI